MARIFEHEIMDGIRQRWSPRAFDTAAIPQEDIDAVLEAARWAPSCFNEQPWRFIVASDKNALKKMRGVLSASNRVWAGRAPVLMLILSKKTFAENGAANPWHAFDAGTAWGYLSLEAQRRGLITHAMGGFDKAAARLEYGIPDDHNVITAVALGRYGNKSDLPKDLQKREKPGTRKAVGEMIFSGQDPLK